MGIWKRVGDALDGGADKVSALFDWLGGLLGGIADPATRRQVAFSIAMIALSAKMAKADGIVTKDEVAAFRRIFVVEAREERSVDRLFDLATRDVAGFESYAARIAAIYGNDVAGLTDVVDGLFAIARADGAVHEAELVYLERVAGIFGIDAAAFERITERHAIGAEGDPYVVLGVRRGLPLADIRRQYLALVAESHPDKLVARGVPPECLAVANQRLAAINRAYERIERELRG
jgi:DnaJ like chaperone protein